MKLRKRPPPPPPSTNPKKKGKKVKENPSKAQAKVDDDEYTDDEKGHRPANQGQNLLLKALKSGSGPGIKKRLTDMMEDLRDQGIVNESDTEDLMESINAVSDGLAAQKKGQAATKKGQVFDEDDTEAMLKDQTMLDALDSSNSTQANNDMKLLIKDAVKNGLWRKIKIITNPSVRTKAAEIVLDLLNFQSMQGDSAASEAYKQKWIKVYEKPLVRALNEQRSYVQSRLKSKVETYWRKHDKQMPPLDRLLAVIRRDLALNEEEGEKVLSQEDCHLLTWWVTRILPIAAGNMSDWGHEHYLYMTVQEGHFPESASKLYITDSTEAVALWLIENNYESWPMTWEAKDKYGQYLVIKKAKKDGKDEDFTWEESCVSDF